MTFYHGTTTTFEKPILKFGLRPSAETWAGLGARPFGPSAVWLTDSFFHAEKYAVMAAGVLRTRKGEKVVGNMVGRPLVKGSPAYDPNAYPVIFAVEIDESKYPISPSRPGEFRCTQAIPPEHLRRVYRAVDGGPM